MLLILKYNRYTILYTLYLLYNTLKVLKIVLNGIIRNGNNNSCRTYHIIIILLSFMYSVNQIDIQKIQIHSCYFRGTYVYIFCLRNPIELF